MLTEKRIVWLASYPKSGNTWFRAFLTSILSNGKIDINDLKSDGIFSSKVLLEDALDLSADYLTRSQIEQFQRITYSHYSAVASEDLFIKIHDAYLVSEWDGLPLIPEAPSKQAIYFVRNPLDVTLSLANHTGLTIDETINRFINNHDGNFAGKENTANNQFFQPLRTWSMHVKSWLENTLFPVHFVRYEDMKLHPFQTFKKIVNFLGHPSSDSDIYAALEVTKFENLRLQETKQGFREKQLPSSSFFHKGEIGRWKNELSKRQIEEIKEVNKSMMEHFNYIN